MANIVLHYSKGIWSKIEVKNKLFEVCYPQGNVIEGSECVIPKVGDAFVRPYDINGFFHSIDWYADKLPEGLVFVKRNATWYVSEKGECYG